MAFRVEISPEAFADLDRIDTYIEVRGTFEIAERWFESILRAIGSLAEMPQRCPLAEDPATLKLRFASFYMASEIADTKSTSAFTNRQKRFASFTSATGR